MQKSVERVSNSIVKGQKIGIFGDYDVDGASSTALLGNYLKKIKNNLKYIFLIEKQRAMVHL